MLQRGRRVLGRVKGYLISHLKASAYAMAYRGVVPAAWHRQLIARFWDDKAGAIHTEWGAGREDYALLGEVLARYRPASLLDAGCGSGRLFPLYQQYGVQQVVGIDISESALKIAQQAFPGADLRCIRLTDMPFTEVSFDLSVCNRVLQHIPSTEIRQVVAKLVDISRWVYVNELTESDEVQQAFFMRRYDYEALFGDAGMLQVERGLIGKQTYMVFGRRTSAPDKS